MSNDLVWALASDQQFPYHDKRMITLWFKALKYLKPDAVDYLGDVSDQACYSRFSKGTPEEFKLKYDLEAAPILQYAREEEYVTREFYAQTRQMLPDADIFVALGNHDIRIFDYAEKNFPEELVNLTPENLWGLDSIGAGYIYYSDLPKRRFGDMHVHHGFAISQHAGDSVRKDVENFGVSMIRGHSHRVGDFHKTFELAGSSLRGYEIGHMADIKNPGMSYTPVHNWQQAFAFAIVENGEYPHVQLVRVSPDYSCYIGKRKLVA
ncbi:MAG: hypothetical protein LC650_01025 [Actinobacteria bacterium]|nr:hypothetical protein [Actinomycetota bacterium]